MSQSLKCRSAVPYKTAQAENAELDAPVGQVAIVARYPKLMEMDETTSVGRFLIELEEIPQGNNSVSKDLQSLRLINRFPSAILDDTLNGQPRFYDILCKMDAGDYPWDRASCAFEISSIEKNASELRLIPVFVPGEPENIENSKWKIAETLASTQLYTVQGQQFDLATFTLNFKRKCTAKFTLLLWAIFLLNTLALISEKFLKNALLIEAAIWLVICFISPIPQSQIGVLIACNMFLLLAAGMIRAALPQLLFGFRKME
ncbi:unnamed protein product, partial [Mesorhabditis spiculigera]